MEEGHKPLRLLAGAICASLKNGDEGLKFTTAAPVKCECEQWVGLQSFVGCNVN